MMYMEPTGQNFITMNRKKEVPNKPSNQVNMKRNIILAILISLSPFFIQAQIAIKAETIYTVSGSPIRNGVVLVSKGKIEQVGLAADVSIPAGYKVYETKVLTPGFVDARTLVGISGSLNIPTDQDQLEKSGPIQPNLRAIDAYNPEEALVKVVRDYGVTTIHTGHGIGALVSGQTMIAKTKPGTVETVTIQPLCMLAIDDRPICIGQFFFAGYAGKANGHVENRTVEGTGLCKKAG